MVNSTGHTRMTTVEADITITSQGFEPYLFILPR